MANRLEENIEFLKRCITKENGHSEYIVDSLRYVIERVETAYQQGYEQGKKDSPKLVDSGQLELPPIDFD